jgi:hypothetical protein
MHMGPRHPDAVSCQLFAQPAAVRLPFADPPEVHGGAPVARSDLGRYAGYRVPRPVEH